MQGHATAKVYGPQDWQRLETGMLAAQALAPRFRGAVPLLGYRLLFTTNSFTLDLHGAAKLNATPCWTFDLHDRSQEGQTFHQMQ